MSATEQQVKPCTRRPQRILRTVWERKRVTISCSSSSASSAVKSSRWMS